MAITTSTDVTPEQTAKEYAVKFQVPANAPEVDWVRGHQQEYLNLVRSKDEICGRNGIDPDKFPIQIKVDPLPNAMTNGGMSTINTYTGINAKDSVDFVHPVTIHTGTLVPSMSERDRQEIIAHEMGHHLSQRPQEQQQALIKKVFSKHFDWLGDPIKPTLAKTGLEISRDAETRADLKGAELTCSAGDMATALQHLGDIKLQLKSGKIISVEEVNAAPNSDHPSIKSRIQTLNAAAPEIAKKCRDR